MDLLFIAVLGWGVAGAAYATIFSQMISALLALITLCRQNGATKLVLSKVRFQLEPLKAVIRYGIPTGVQNSIISLANVVVQSNINAFGPEAMAGCGAYSKLEGFAFLPIMSFNMAISTFVGQNIGAKDYERTLKGAKFGILCGVISCELVGLIFFCSLLNLFQYSIRIRLSLPMEPTGPDAMRCSTFFLPILTRFPRLCEEEESPMFQCMS